MSCYNQWDLKPGILNVSGLCSGRAEVDCGKLSHCPQRASRTNNPQKYTQKLQFEKCLGHTGGGLIHLRVCPKGTGFTERFLPVKELTTI